MFAGAPFRRPRITEVHIVVADADAKIAEHYVVRANFDAVISEHDAGVRAVLAIDGNEWLGDAEG